MIKKIFELRNKNKEGGRSEGLPQHKVIREADDSRSSEVLPALLLMVPPPVPSPPPSPTLLILFSHRHSNVLGAVLYLYVFLFIAFFYRCILNLHKYHCFICLILF